MLLPLRLCGTSELGHRVVLVLEIEKEERKRENDYEEQ